MQPDRQSQHVLAHFGPLALLTRTLERTAVGSMYASEPVGALLMGTLRPAMRPGRVLLSRGARCNALLLPWWCRSATSR